MSSDPALVRISDLRLELPGVAARPVLDGIDLTIDRGEVVGLVGESGSGKSVTARTILGLFPRAATVTGSVRVNGTEVLGASAAALRTLRSRTVSMVFQDPRAGINPLRRIGDHLGEALRLVHGSSRAQARATALDLLHAVGLPDPERHLRQYPHELSGGMLQRVMIAGALSVQPDLLLCDEPTTALDVTTQAEIVAILRRLQRDNGMGMLFITHDLDLAAATCDRICVMYAGRLVEIGAALDVFTAPRHPYTAGLLTSRPGIEADAPPFVPIPGAPLSLGESVPGCAFAPRCGHAEPACTVGELPLRWSDGHATRCRRSDELTDLLLDRPPAAADQVAAS